MEADVFGNVSKKLSEISGSRDALRSPTAVLLHFYLAAAIDVIDPQHETGTTCFCVLRSRLLWCVCFCLNGLVFAVAVAVAVRL